MGKQIRKGITYNTDWAIEHRSRINGPVETLVQNIRCRAYGTEANLQKVVI